MTSASYFWDLWESKSILKIPIMSLAPSVPKHSILIKEWWRQRQMSQDRRTASHQSYYLHRSECFEATHHIWTLAISRNAPRVHSSETAHGLCTVVCPNILMQWSRRCRLWNPMWCFFFFFFSGCVLAVHHSCIKLSEWNQWKTQIFSRSWELDDLYDSICCHRLT